ncbi:hypothetical protein IAT40_004245 [Kwoniella sp. CBS 6097]
MTRPAQLDENTVRATTSQALVDLAGKPSRRSNRSRFLPVASATDDSNAQLAAQELLRRLDAANTEIANLKSDLTLSRAETESAVQQARRLDELYPCFRRGASQCTDNIMKDVCAIQVSSLPMAREDLRSRAYYSLLNDASTQREVSNLVSVYTDMNRQTLIEDSSIANEQISDGSWISHKAERVNGRTIVTLSRRDMEHRARLGSIIDDGEITDPVVLGHLQEETSRPSGANRSSSGVNDGDGDSIDTEATAVD